jgi:DNA polymerase elongation subunit (family B)|tara:strand:- start:4574 stop:5530 length:957 start_codon:yes stop_codon:yes gene_type:complete
MKVVYGHTDSIYVKIPDLVGETFIEHTRIELNDHVRSKFPNLLGLKEHPINIEWEKLYETLGVGLTKNRNAGLINWKDGEKLEEPEFVMTGFTAKRMSITPLEKEVQLKILRMWVEKKPKEEIDAYCNTMWNKVAKGNIDLDQICKRSRYRSERFKAKCSCGKEYSFKKLLEIHKSVEDKRQSIGFKKASLIQPICNKCGNRLSKFTTIKDKRITIGSGIEGVLNYNNHHTHNITDSYVYIKTKANEGGNYFHPLTGNIIRSSWLSAPSIKELLGVKPDWLHYANTIVKKAEPIYNAMGWTTTEISRDISQKTLDEWW